MKITIELKELQKELESAFKEVDAKQIKAVLFDLIVSREGDIGTTQVIQQSPVEPMESAEPSEEPSWLEEMNRNRPIVAEDAFEVTPELAGVLGESQSPSPDLNEKIQKFVNPKNNVKATKVEVDINTKEKKRKEMEKLTSLSSKELMDQLLSSKMGKRNEVGQFVNLGSEGSASSDDEAFG